MKNLFLILMMGVMAFVSACQKDDSDDRFDLLTRTTWVSDSLLVNGVDASGTGQLLEDFKGEVIFNRDGTGSFGSYTGIWRFAQNRTQLVIESTSLPMPLSTVIHELSERNLKLSTSFPNMENPSEPLLLRLTFKAK
jgi:hypothetical protein